MFVGAVPLTAVIEVGNPDQWDSQVIDEDVGRRPPEELRTT